jgi:hypothetical protein
MVAPSATRVPQHTSEESNQKIREQTEKNIAYYMMHPHLIDDRLRELDEEWDVERSLETCSASFSLIGLGLGIIRSRKWFAVPIIVQSFFLQHALQGWCPPLAICRALGFRTRDEIAVERYALKAIRGDFAGVKRSKSADPTQVLQAAS